MALATDDFSWVRRAYEWFSGPENPDPDPALMETFDALLRVNDINVVWSAIGRRFHEQQVREYEERLRAYLETATNDYDVAVAAVDDYDAAEEESVSRQINVMKLVSACHDGTREFAFSEELTQAQRSRLAKKIEDVTAEYIRLISTLRRVTDRRFVSSVEARLDGFVQNLSHKRWLPHVQGSQGPSQRYFGSGADHGAWVVMRNIPELLASVASGAADWAAESPLVSRPGSDNAARTYFIRRVTGFLMKEYGLPLRKSVIVLASAFFDVSDLDESTVAKLAPAT